jgi:enolase-phosphatase E1
VIELSVRGVLLDIEGTTSSIRFVYDEMFPYVRRELAGFLDANWNGLPVMRARQQLARDAEQAGAGPPPRPDDRDWVVAEVHRLMDADAKSTGLKELQGLIWQRGFESGELRAHLFDDVAPALHTWHAAGLSVRIYSSGSIAAQKLFFGHTALGNLLPLFDGHYDTTIGPKKAAASYQSIALDWDLPAEAILFLSDVPAELDAASAADMQTVLVRRPGNAEVDVASDHRSIRLFAELALCADHQPGGLLLDANGNEPQESSL